MLSLPRSERVVPLVVAGSLPSTNTELVARARREPLAPFTTVVTDDQTAGRGRLDRSWTAPPGTSLAISVLLPRVAPERAGWMPLAAGLAMADAVSGVLPERVVGVKWPNDVLVGGRKLSGILAELLPTGQVVLGAGLNVTMGPEELPVPTATSLTIEGAQGSDLADRVLEAYLSGLRRWVEGYLAAGADAGSSGLRSAVRHRCVTLGQEVRIELPGSVLIGSATDLDPDGRLLVRSADGTHAVAAGDVTHVR